MKNILFTILIMSSILCNSQFYISSGDDVYVSDQSTLYSNEDIENNGTIRLKNESYFIFDADLINNATISYQDGTSKGILQIGSGEASSNQAQDIQFNATQGEEAPFIILNKTSGIANITRGHMRLLERFKSISGTLNADSEITGADTNENISKGLTFINPDILTTSIVEESSGGMVKNVITELLFPEDSKRAFKFFSSSVTMPESINANLQEGGHVTSTAVGTFDDPYPGYGIHITGSETGERGFDATNTGYPSMFLWENGDQEYSVMPNTDQRTLNAGEASLILVRGSRVIDLTVDNVQNNFPTILRTIGDLHIGDFTLTNLASTTEQFSLIGNPYHAEVDLDALLKSSNNVGLSKSFLYYFDPTLGSQGSYVTLDLSDQSTTPFSLNSKYLQPNQSFFIENIADNPSLTFKESFKRTNEQRQNNKIFSADTDLRIDVSMFDSNADVFRDGVTLRFNPNYSEQATLEEDATKVWNSDGSVAIQNQGEYLSVDKRPLQNNMVDALLYMFYSRDNDQILINLDYHLEIDVKNLPSSGEVVLIDNYLETRTPLNLNSNIYSFSLDPILPESENVNRFELGFENMTLGTTTPQKELAFLSLYPNPTTGLINIDLKGAGETLKSVKIFSTDGKLVKQINFINNSTEQIDISDLSKGFYLVELQTANTIYVEKLILN
ncbi:T9SS type A sorting domain-containing protein [Psychroflexus sp. MES1-P1E]|uniref:T9SS type A sorting domain-containing protein n=1 Tax=Psychroflexus sp. MES1-P1E TaxID=2058320 RepID=UPI000C7B0406|nr:T9SS type A sorting domain-containing protein [Psychroflexus sp. MES1-P1E]PKG41608.1 hypothetical protein CXF67_14700 [Psychroflexus sp. MES1-P1E]